MNNGVVYAFAAFAMWGLFPLYFKALHQVAPLELLAHRMAWSMLFLFLLLTLRSRWRWLKPVLRDKRLLAHFAASAVLLSTNWGVYIWAVNAGHIVEASLGYFINPLINVLFGFFILGERLRRLQWFALAIAATGVLWLTWQNGQPPWISVALAVTFAGYGLLRKTARLGALEGLTLETLLLFPLAFAFLVAMAGFGKSSFVNAPLTVEMLLAAAGPITAIPLLLFAAGARRIPLSTLGVIQYVTPTLQLLIGVCVYHEPFDATQMVGYGLIWVALLVYSLEGVWRARLGAV